jgi:hypothetical protein
MKKLKYLSAKGQSILDNNGISNINLYKLNIYDNIKIYEISHMTNLEELSLSGQSKITNLITLINIKKLSLSNCCKLIDISYMDKLTYLHLSNTNKLRYLPINIVNLKIECNKGISLIKNADKLLKLKKLDIRNSISNGFTGLININPIELIIDNVSIINNIGSMINLKKLICPENIKNLQYKNISLKYLYQLDKFKQYLKLDELGFIYSHKKNNNLLVYKR